MSLYHKSKVWLNYLLDRIIDWIDMVLMDAYQLPAWLPHNTTKKSFRYLGNLCWFLRDFPRLSAYKLIGSHWTIVLIGSEKSLPEVQHLFFNNQEINPVLIGRVALWKIETQTKQWLTEDVDLVICELSQIFPFQLRLPIVFNTPTWIQQELEMPASLESMLTGKSMKTIRHNLNRAKKAGFSWYFSQDKQDFDLFHYQMYIPFIESRHRDRALLSPYNDQWQRWFTRGGLIMITQNQKPVGGLLFFLKNDTFYAIEEGVLNADMKLFDQGIKTSSIWFAINWAHQQGAKVYNMGGSRPLCSDGVFFSKSRWRTHAAERQRIYSVWTFLAHSLPFQLQAHINDLGIITKLEDKFYRILLRDKISGDVKQKVLEAQKQGLAGIAVVVPDEKMEIYE